MGIPAWCGRRAWQNDLVAHFSPQNRVDQMVKQRRRYNFSALRGFAECQGTSWLEARNA